MPLVRICLLVAGILMSASGTNAGAAPVPQVPGTWLPEAEMALLRGSYVRCLAEGFGSIGYPITRTALAKIFTRDSEDMSLWVTSHEVRNAPRVTALNREYIACAWFGRNSPRPYPE
ncbi:MAG: hypothetical protein HYX47_21460 [Burkholderiales bacterium]|nr:hypothetical protein [Burkholderiales bacterium]